MVEPSWTVSARFGRSLWLLAGCLSAAALAEDVRPHAGMMRYPDVSATQIAFAYANDLWLVARDGGSAIPLASPPGEELFPKFSADGKTIAFIGNYDGNRDIYTIPVAGGTPARVTHHPDTELLCDWTPDGKLLYNTSAFAGLQRQRQLYSVPTTGGLPTKLPVPYGAMAAISSDGQWLAYTPHSIDTRTWKRYRGGMSTDIWLFNLTSHESKQITDWEGLDSIPMWNGKTVYYVSDNGDEHRLNIWKYDTTNGQRKQVTTFKDDDVKWPSIGPGPDGGGEIVLQNGPDLYLLDLKTEKTRKLEVVIPGDRPKIRPLTVDAAKNLASWDVSASGNRAVAEARGDIWTLPAQHGTARNLTRTSGIAERDPAWSPDGQWIAYFSDQTGEYELYMMQSDGAGETKQLTQGGTCFKYSPSWSPDSKRIAFSDKTGAMFLHTLGGDTKKFDTEPWAGQTRMNWSPDSAWIAYTKGGDNQISSIWLYDVKGEKPHQVTSGVFNYSWPTFDRKGDYLLCASNCTFEEPAYEDVGNSFIYGDTDRLLVISLRDDVVSPFAPKSDEEKWGEAKKEEEKKKKEEEARKKGEPASSPASSQAASSGASQPATQSAPSSDGEKPEEIKPVKIDLENFERRAVLLPIERGSFAFLNVNDKGQALYVRQTRRNAEGDPAIKLFDLSDDETKEKSVLDGVGMFAMSADGKKILVRKGSTLAIVEATTDRKLDKPIDQSAMKTDINPREEWRQIFHDAWRIQRDFFYDPHMHGLDWKAVHDHYEAMLPDCVSREDVSFIIREMISEMNVGHAYYFGGDVEDAPSRSVGMLGCDFDRPSGAAAYRISRIYEGHPSEADARGPLSQPGVKVNEGDYLLAVNGVPLDMSKDPWAAFQGLAGKTVTLTVSDKPARDDSARELIVKLLDSEAGVRYRAWIEHNRKYVADKTGAKVGYIYVPDTGVNGQNNLFRQFYGQIDRAALIIDERWNGGGQIPTRFIELLNRPVTNYWARRDGHDWKWPPDSHQGPKCMLINGLAGSGGDMFPWLFRFNKLGKIIGMRTWGGLVGISGNPALIDGGSTTAPTFAFYEKNGTWGIEGHGVDPDMEVVDDPAKMWEGGDPQLDAAIALMLTEIEQNGYRPPKRPEYPDRRGMGIREEDK